MAVSQWSSHTWQHPVPTNPQLFHNHCLQVPIFENQFSKIVMHIWNNISKYWKHNRMEITFLCEYLNKWQKDWNRFSWKISEEIQVKGISESNNMCEHSDTTAKGIIEEQVYMYTWHHHHVIFILWLMGVHMIIVWNRVNFFLSQCIKKKNIHVCEGQIKAIGHGCSHKLMLKIRRQVSAHWEFKNPILSL